MNSRADMLRSPSTLQEPAPSLPYRQTPSALWLRVVMFCLALCGVAGLLALVCAPLRFLPAEDVVILHQYSHSLAAHGAITYYAGGPHTEGATDFGWMILLAAAMRLGASPVWFTAVVNALSLVDLAFVLLRIAGRRPTLLRVLALCGAASLLPQLLAAVSGFAVLPDALLLALLVLAALRGQPVRSALLALALCLFRPDGIVFALPLLCLLLEPKPRRAHRLLTLAALFALPLAAYFVWRAHYFHALLPLPFLVKSDAHRVLGLFVPHSVWQSLRYLLLLAALLISTGQFTVSQRRILTCLVVVPTLFFWAMRLDQNIGDRFYFALPLAAAILLALVWRDVPSSRKSAVFVTAGIGYLVLLLGPYLREFRSFRDFQFRDVQQIAVGLGALPTRGTLLTSEAGFLAYNSGWISYDAWGLDTAAFAKRLIQPADVVTIRPDLIVVHPPRAAGCHPHAAPAQTGGVRTWDGMTQNIFLGAKGAGDYDLWQLSYGSDYYRRRNHWSYGEGDPECFLVRRDSPLHEGIANLLATHHAVPEGEE